MSKIKIPLKEVSTNQLLPEGEFTANSRYFKKNNKPWIPIMGEFHYSRYPEKEWERELWKMKSGGIEIVATYVIWIHHEEEKGHWDFEGQKNLRRFIQICKKVGLKFFLRVGPFAHGEVRNGGLPDWLITEVVDIRSNDSKYQYYVTCLFKQIFQQVKGFFSNQGGPIIGIQVENEYGHVGGDNGSEGIAHMRWLHQTLKDIGFNVPFYTATGWGGGVWVDEMLPVFGGYVESPWAQTTDSLPLSENFLLLPQRDDNTIASDHFIKENLAIKNIEGYPYMTAELGGGIQVTHHRRPYADGVDIARQALSMFASGANLLGYYMYHGGTNPEGKLSTLQESKATGYLNDLPVLSYDFQAPIGEFGIFHNSYGKLRRIHQFVKSFETYLAESVIVFPEDPITDPVSDELRISVRHHYPTGGGFVFISNYQRLAKRKKYLDFQMKIQINGQIIVLPEIDLEPGDFKIIPYRMKIGDSIVESSNAELAMILGETLVFVHPNPEKAEISFKGKEPSFVILSDEDLNKGLYVNGQLWVCDREIWMEKNQLVCHTEHNVSLTCYPQGDKRKIKVKDRGKSGVDFESYLENDHICYKLNMFYDDMAISHRLKILFESDRLELWDGDKLIADHFMINGEWELVTERFGNPESLLLKLFPPTENVYYDIPLSPKNMKLKSISLNPYYEIKLDLINF